MAFLTMEDWRRYGRARSCTRDHVFLQIEPSRRLSIVRACPLVPELVYPSRTRGALSVLQTDHDCSAALRAAHTAERIFRSNYGPLRDLPSTAERLRSVRVRWSCAG
jgi:hypothetical protein